MPRLVELFDDEFARFCPADRLVTLRLDWQLLR